VCTCHTKRRIHPSLDRCRPFYRSGGRRNKNIAPLMSLCDTTQKSNATFCHLKSFRSSFVRGSLSRKKTPDVDESDQIMNTRTSSVFRGQPTKGAPHEVPCPRLVASERKTPEQLAARGFPPSIVTDFARYPPKTLRRKVRSR